MQSRQKRKRLPIRIRMGKRLHIHSEQKNAQYVIRNYQKTQLNDNYSSFVEASCGNRWKWNGYYDQADVWRTRFMIGFVVIFIELFIGVILGGIAGFFGGWVDNIISGESLIYFIVFPLCRSILFWDLSWTK